MTTQSTFGDTAEVVSDASRAAEIVTLGADLQEWQGIFEKIGEPSYRAVQAFEAIHKHRSKSWHEVSNLPSRLRDRLEIELPIARMKTAGALQSADGTVKMLFEPEPGSVIESVIIPTKYGPALCVSSQIGCPVGCLFCQTGQMGLGRNLTAGEIVSQFYAAEEHIDGVIESVILMGMGEPMLNVKNVDKALKLITHSKGRDMAARRITVSTVGYPKRIRELPKLGWKFNIALSLHFTSNLARRKFIPVSAKHPLQEIFESLETYHASTGADITLEYILLDGINTSAHDARALAYLSRWGWDDDVESPDSLLHFYRSGRYRSKPFSRDSFKVNLIPFNPINPNAKTLSKLAGDKLACPAEDKMEKFFMQIKKYGARVTLRRPRGRDIDAACGMLGKVGKN